MREIEKQIVIFGKFDEFTFSNLGQLSSFFDAANMHLDGLPDPPKPNIRPGISIDSPPIRPMFITEDKKRRVVFGTFRISVEEFDSKSSNYGSFLEFSIEFFKKLYDHYEINPNRLAINGRFINDIMTLPYYHQKFITNVDLTGDLNNFSFNVDKKIQNEELGTYFNQIINMQRVNLQLNNSQPIDGILFSYDFNTLVETKRAFNLEDFNKFIKHAINFREFIEKDVMHL